MSEFSVSEQTVNEAAQACAQRLAKWFGGVDEAIAALESDPVVMAEIAIADHMKTTKALSVRAHMNIGAFSKQVHSLALTNCELPGY